MDMYYLWGFGHKYMELKLSAGEVNLQNLIGFFWFCFSLRQKKPFFSVVRSPMASDYLHHRPL